MQKRIIAVDIGGSKILSGILTCQGQILARAKEPTLAQRSVADMMDSIVATVKRLSDEIGLKNSEVMGIAVGAPGPLNYATGVILDPPNLNWRNLPLRDELSHRLGMPVLLENDANLAALGESKFGSSMVSRNLVYMTVSTGVGGGIIINGQIYRGRDGGAGEFGRMIIQSVSNGKSMNGVLEGLASGTAIARIAQDMVSQGRGQEFMQQCLPGCLPTAREIGAAARLGFPQAEDIILKAGGYLGIAAANLVNIFNPERIVIGGGVGLGLQDLFCQPIQDGLNVGVTSSLGHDLKVEFTNLGEDIGLLGGVAAILQEVGK